ncbi:MAG: helix-turn-helix domain-containing protein [Actinomycetota bacterium]
MSDAAAHHVNEGDDGAAIRLAVAENMRRARLTKGMSLRELSGRTGLSTALLSQIEREVANPTVAALTRISSAIDLTFADLTRAPLIEAEIVRASEAPVDAPSGRMLFAMMERRRFDISEGVLPAHTAGVFSDHGRGSIEHGYVVAGEVTLQLGDATHRLGPGDAVRFSSSVPHAYSTGPSAATLLTVVVYADD